MLEAESRGMAGRVADLERRVLEQGDELVCLKATLAEVLRRINLLEGMRLAHQVPSAPSTPVRNGNPKELRIRQTNYSATKLVQKQFFCVFFTNAYPVYIQNNYFYLQNKESY